MSDIHERAKQEKTLQEQVEHILEEDCSDTLQVVVRMASPEDARETLVAIASDRAQKRSMAFELERCSPRSAATRRASRANGRPRHANLQRRVTARVAAARIVGPESTDALQQKGEAFLEPLIKSDVPKKSVAKTFWTSKAALLEVTRDRARKATRQGAECQRRLLESLSSHSAIGRRRKNLPSVVTESFGYSWGIHKIGALAAWGAYGASGKRVKVGLLDTGVDADHPAPEGQSDGLG